MLKPVQSHSLQSKGKRLSIWLDLVMDMAHVLKKDGFQKRTTRTRKSFNFEQDLEKKRNLGISRTD